MDGFSCEKERFILPFVHGILSLLLQVIILISNVVKSVGDKNAVIIDIATVDQFASFSSFRSTVLSRSLTATLNPSPSVRYTNVRGDTIERELGKY
jgi:hypothetical protein